MIIYVDKEPWKKFPWIVPKDGGRLALVLVGVNFEGGRGEPWSLEPVYRPILHIWRSPGILHLEFPGLLVMLMRRKPWIIIERQKSIELESTDENSL
jgi:hypothetical protein